LSYSLRPKLLFILATIILIAATLRLLQAVSLWQTGINDGLEAYSFSVFFPCLIFSALAISKHAKTKEGLLMRLGCMIQLILIISIPSFSLYLALGFPVVFLVIELFETKVPKTICEPIERLIIND
jgi:predicted permease